MKTKRTIPFNMKNSEFLIEVINYALNIEPLWRQKYEPNESAFQRQNRLALEGLREKLKAAQDLYYGK